MPYEFGMRPMTAGNEVSFGEDLEKEIGLLLREQGREADDFERELNLYRCGSAPPTVEGSLSAVGGLFNDHGSNGMVFSEFAGDEGRNGFASEEELRSDPAYLSYYYSNVNLNPRLPPPLLSKEDWRFTQRLKGVLGTGGIGERRMIGKNDSGAGVSLFSMPPGFSSKENEILNAEKLKVSAQCGGYGLTGLPGLGLGSKQKILCEGFQDDLSRATPVFGYLSRPTSQNSFFSSDGRLSVGATEMATLQCNSNDSSLSGAGVQSYSYAAALSRNTTPDLRVPSPCPTPIDGERAATSDNKINLNDPNPFNEIAVDVGESQDLIAALTRMNLSNGATNDENHATQLELELNDAKNYLFNLPEDQAAVKPNTYSRKSEHGISCFPLSLSDPASAADNLYPKGSFDDVNSSFSNYDLSGYSVDSAPMLNKLSNFNMPPLFENAAAAAFASAIAVPGIESRMNSESQSRVVNQMAHHALQTPVMDPSYLQYLRAAEYASASQIGSLNDPYLDANYVGNSYADLFQKAYISSMLSPPKSQYDVQLNSKSGTRYPHGYYGSPAFGVGLSYPGSPLAGPIFPNSPVRSSNPIRHGEFNRRSSCGMRNSSENAMGSWSLDDMHNCFGSSLLEEFKINKTKCFELLDITGHVVEFSTDQYGSRFIQQKLETATVDEKDMVFKEIFPHALTLMTDVFGNYVIQKFFEHGMLYQRRELAEKLFGHVLSLSLQMYGCRVIQKAIEVVDLDQKVKMVQELDGHIMRCVRDQNGNHVIQKCIECVPEEHIQFIISTFFDQVVILSTHPYGCRVIQRVLEHCKDPKTQCQVMEEILGCVSMLTQDQYGNYVIQHVLEHGKPNESSVIINELAGKIVHMSQQKFASNVVEKCLTFGDPSERKLLVNEILGSADENEPLQAMMKDQFGNYVVQKVLETCSDREFEVILSRIKVYLNALKKYTYGKHIVARVEKLVAAGERRVAAQSQRLALD